MKDANCSPVDVVSVDIVDGNDRLRFITDCQLKIIHLKAAAAKHFWQQQTINQAEIIVCTVSGNDLLAAAIGSIVIKSSISSLQWNVD